MNYKDFRLDGPRHLTRINDDTYRKTCTEISPWSVIPGWCLDAATYDFMHIVYLGIARDLIPSLLGDWISCGVLGPAGESVDHRLRAFSIEMNNFFKQEKFLGYAIFVLVPI